MPIQGGDGTTVAGRGPAAPECECNRQRTPFRKWRWEEHTWKAGSARKKQVGLRNGPTRYFVQKVDGHGRECGRHVRPTARRE